MTATQVSSPDQLATGALTIPGPPWHHSLRWLRRLGGNILRGMDSLAEEYGDVARITIGHQSIVFVRGNDAIKHVLVANQDNYPKSHQFDLFRPILGNGLVTSDGDTWRRSRRMVNPVFAKRHLGVYADHMAAAAEDAVDVWDRKADCRSIDLDAEMLHIGLDTVFRALVSHDVANTGDDLGVLIGDALHEIGQMSRSPAAMLLQDVKRVGIVRAARVFTPKHWRQYTSLAERTDAVMQSLVDDRLAHGHAGRNDLLALLIDSPDPETGDRLTRRQVIDEIKTFIAAGHETTAHGLAWMFYLLGHHPAARTRLEDEVDTVLGSRQRPRVEDVERMPWLKACFLEAMRLYPPVWHIPRVAVDDDVVNGYRVPAGSRIMVSVWSTHRDPVVYDRPEEFEPERWMNGGAAERPRFSYLPFGGGRRACVGQGFALLNAAMLGAVVVQRYRFDSDPNIKIKLEPTITLRPVGGIPATAHRR